MNMLLDKSKIQRVLIIRIDKVGDLIVSTPAILGIRESLPHARLTLLTQPYNAAVLQGWHVLDEIQVYDRGWSRWKKWLFVKQLRAVQYDLCVVMSPKMTAYYLAYLSGAPLRLGKTCSHHLVASFLTPFLLTHQQQFRLDEAESAQRALPHEVQQLLQTNARVGLCDTERAMEVPLLDQDRQQAHSLLVDQLPDRKKFIGFHLSGKWLGEGWTGADLRRLCEEMLASCSYYGLLITFGPADIKAVAALLRALSEGELVLNGRGSVLRRLLGGRALLVGNLQFTQWTALLSCCQLVVTQDTGALHLAAALGKPVVGVYASATYVMMSQLWFPWFVPHCIVKQQSYAETTPAILQGIAALLDEALPTLC